MNASLWIPYNRSLHESIIKRGGKDKDGSIVVIGRAQVNNELIPGKVILSQGKCYVSLNGQEVSAPSFEVLVNTPGLVWKEGENGSVPSNAVIGGKTATNETLFVGRARHGTLKIPGKIHPSHKCIYYPFDMKEQASKKYEVLVREEKTKVAKLKANDVSWITYNPGQNWPSNAVTAGYYNEKNNKIPQYIARRHHQKSMLIGYAYKGGPFYGGFHGKEITYQNFEVLVENSTIFPKDN